jgi:drug/metabolite transporter (DMT)-like permease
MTVVWGGTFIFIKLAIGTLNPSLFVAIRFGIALLVSLILWIRVIPNLPRRSVGVGLVVGIVMFAGYYFQTIGLKTTTAIQSGFITGAYVVFTPILESLFLKKLPKLRILVAILWVILGLYFISFGGNTWEDWNHWSEWNPGDLLTLIGAFFFALYIVIIDLSSRKYHETGLMMGQMISCFLCGSLIFLWEWTLFSETLDLRFSSWAIFGLFYTGVIATILPMYVQTRYQKAVNPSRAGIIFSLEPVFASIFAFLIAGESMTRFGAIGCLVIFATIAVSEWVGSRKKSKTETTDD